MTGHRETVRSGYSFHTFDEELGKAISFREVDLERDLGRLHTWLNSDHVLPYWQQNDPLPRVHETLRKRASDPHQTLYIGYLDHTPMSYWESYWAAEDRIGEYYDADPADQGVHLLIGPTEYLGKGYAAPLVKALVAFQFQHPETERIVTEPDIRNETVIHVFEKCGFEPQGEVELPDKTGLLMFCTRERFEGEIG
ncbi:GNAT family N-acetyltransferase [Halalkalicoccus subterraneus]|uniref:GNAT family N-acetyltransferase n=1 Tax=Halalkalicoccus subterraneus TaxID=2675002 RepID=UPI000EFC8189|nr:GNAT family N-acetyltransferase [Halalkalicoccus subterraneus]